MAGPTPCGPCPTALLTALPPSPPALFLLQCFGVCACRKAERESSVPAALDPEDFALSSSSVLMIGGCFLSLVGVAPSGGTAVIGGGEDDDNSCLMAPAPGLGPTGATAGASAEIIFRCVTFCRRLVTGVDQWGYELDNTMERSNDCSDMHGL